MCSMQLNMLEELPVDPSRVYLTGTSGGGYMSLLLAGRSHKAFAAVSAWVPISDLIVWYKDSSKRRNKYAENQQILWK